MNNYFPDLQHVEQIRRALWLYGSQGRAAVMVGAGMSMNANTTQARRTRMPRWQDLTRAMINRLYATGVGMEQKRNDALQSANETSSALRLADEFCATFGRASLDEMIRETIADDDFAPGELHKMLLELPWADVLTTNYDTLLERASREISERFYSIIRTPLEIPNASRPRIVKLHGTLPSTGPFILSEEDYRTYPKHFSPFVNLAQEVVMENLLCLIGFSARDPNFLYWTGWVRDHLGPHAPTVYWCGLHQLVNSERLLLHARKVIPVDLTPVFTDQNSLPHDKHQWALRWLLCSLRSGEPIEPLEWPNPPPEDAPPTFPGMLPPLPRPRHNAPRREPWSPGASPE